MQISTFNKNLKEAETLKGRIIMDQSLIFDHIKTAVAIGTSTQNWEGVNWAERLAHEDHKDLINNQLELEMLSQWFTVFWENEENEDSGIELQQAYFAIESILSDLDRIEKITGIKAKTIQASIDALGSYLRKREIKSIKLPLLGTEIDVSLLKTVVPITQIMLLLVISTYLFMTSKLISTEKDASEFLSHTLLYVNKYDAGKLTFIFFLFPRLITSMIIIFVLSGLGVLNIYSWQFWITILIIGLHIASFLILDSRIFKIMKSI
ncbi:MAG: hypothetical protein CL840_02745 [Crocinitomicaceae bacterium]|nr:hypothetical protein [Crocinitomicaceae bacterium]